MSDVGFIPTTRQVREAYEVAHEEVGVPCDIAGFDRWLNDIIQQAKAEALREAAEEFWARLPDGTGNGRAYNSHRVADMLRDRADRIEQGDQP